MARYDVFANPEAAERHHTPYLVDVQNDFIDRLETRVVIPLRREAARFAGRQWTFDMTVNEALKVSKMSMNQAADIMGHNGNSLGREGSR